MLRDFNATLNNLMDRFQKSVGPELPKNFYEYIEYFQMIDVWRKENPTVCDYILFSKPHLMQSRNDFIMVSKKLATEMGSLR